MSYTPLFTIIVDCEWEDWETCKWEETCDENNMQKGFQTRGHKTKAGLLGNCPGELIDGIDYSSKKPCDGSPRNGGGK